MLARQSPEYAEMLGSVFDGIEPPGARQIVVLDVDLVQTSCGYGVPLFGFTGERPTLRRWAEAKGEEGIEQYWRTKNVVSIDGLATGIFDLAEEERVPAAGADSSPATIPVE